MALLARLFDFTPATTIVSADVDSEFNQLVNILNGTSTNKDALIKYNHATDPVLRVDQVGAGVIQRWLQNGTEKCSIRNNGALRINSAQEAADPMRLSVNADANNLGNIVASIQTLGTGDVGLRLAMEGASSAGVTAMQVTKFDGAAVQAYLQIFSGGEIRVPAGHPSAFANIPSKKITLGGQAYHNVSTVGNVGAGQDDLHSYTIDANVLANDGDSLDLIGSGNILAAGSTKELGFSFGGTLAFLSGAFDPAVDIGWSMRITVTRIDSDSVIVAFQFMNSANVNTSGGSAQINGLSFTGTLTAKWTGQDTDGTNDRVTQSMSVVRKFARNV